MKRSAGREGIEWLKQLPTKPGIYLRRNPPVNRVVRQDLFLVGKDLCTSNASDPFSLRATRLKEWLGAKRFWWFGPIPQPPPDPELDAPPKRKARCR